MMKLYSLKGFLFLLLFSVLIFSQLSCKKKEQGLTTTDLKINARFYTNNYYSDPYYYYSKYDETDSAACANATVMLFRSLVDLEARVRPVRTERTDANGNVTIKDVEPFAYYIYVFYDDSVNYYDNSVGNNYLGDPMVEGGITSVSIPVFKIRSSTPTKISMNHIEVIRYNYDTSAALNGGVGCSKYLKFVLYDSYDSYYYIPLDSTLEDESSKFCHVSNTTSDNAKKFYFANDTTQYDLYYYDDFAIITYESPDPFTQAYYPTDTNYLYPSLFFKNNSNNYLPYPIRKRLQEDERKIIYMNESWK